MQFPGCSSTSALSKNPSAGLIAVFRLVRSPIHTDADFPANMLGRKKAARMDTYAQDAMCANGTDTGSSIQMCRVAQ